MDIDGERLCRNTLDTAEFGAIDVEAGHGRIVLTSSEADREAREYLVSELEAAGMTVRVNSVRNVAGQWTPESVDLKTPPVTLGSCLDSVPRSGIFDDALGVYARVEAVRAIRAADLLINPPIDVVSFTEEEGTRFGIGTFSSSVATGKLAISDALELEDDDIKTLEDRLTSIDLRRRNRIDPADRTRGSNSTSNKGRDWSRQEFLSASSMLSPGLPMSASRWSASPIARVRP